MVLKRERCVSLAGSLAFRDLLPGVISFECYLKCRKLDHIMPVTSIAYTHGAEDLIGMYVERIVVTKKQYSASSAVKR